MGSNVTIKVGDRVWVYPESPAVQQIHGERFAAIVVSVHPDGQTANVESERPSEVIGVGTHVLEPRPERCS